MKSISPDTAVKQLQAMQCQIIDGKRTFVDIADCIDDILSDKAKASELLKRCLKWIRRIEERQEDLPPLFVDSCDLKPLRQDIEVFLK